LLASVLLLAGLPLWWLWRRPVLARPFLPQLGATWARSLIALALTAAIVMALFADLSATMRNHKSLRYLINPLNSLFGLAVIATEGQARPKGPSQPIGLDARLAGRPAGSKPPLVMFVIGETARADHFSLNGYARPTNPELATQPVLSFATSARAEPTPRRLCPACFRTSARRPTSRASKTTRTCSICCSAPALRCCG
jgi:lipid A ethanolaminephosphotransferase